MNKKKLLGFALIPTLGAAALAGSVFAASDTTTSTTSTNITKLFKGKGSRDNTQLAQDLATILGLSATDVKAKLDAGTKPDEIITAAGKTPADIMTQMKALHETALKTQLAADVADGKITQAQADAKIANMGNHMNGHGRHALHNSAQFAKDLASILGTTEADIQAKLDANTKLDDIITAAGKTPSDVMTQMKTLREASMKAQLAADVASGKITQAQADEMIAYMANHVNGKKF